MNQPTKKADRNSSTALRLIPAVLGFAGLGIAIFLGILNRSFMTWHLMLGALSIGSILGGLLWLQEAKWRNTLAAMSYSVFFCVSVILVYLISANRHVAFDLTRDQIHTLTPQTIGFLGALPADVRFEGIIYMPEAEQRFLQDLLDSYRREAPQVDFQVLDPTIDIQVVDQFDPQAIAYDATIFFHEAGRQPRRVKENLTPNSALWESRLTNAMVKAAKASRKRVYFARDIGGKPLQPASARGSRNESLSQMIEIISDRVGEVAEIRLGEEIPQDAGVVVLAGPRTDIFDHERDVLINFLDHGGKLLVMIDPIGVAGTELTNIEAVLAHAGVTAPNKFVVDPAPVSQTNSPFTPLASNWSDHPIALGTTKTPFLMRQARPLKPAETMPGDLAIRWIVATGDAVWAEPAVAPRSIRRLQPPEDPKEIHTRYLALSAEKQTPDGLRGETMRLVVFGDSDTFTDDHLSNESATLLFQSINWLQQQEDLLSIPPKLLTGTPIVLTRQHVLAMMGIFLLIGLGLAGGGTAWSLARRRSK